MAVSNAEQLKLQDHHNQMQEMEKIVRGLRDNFTSFCEKCVYIKDHNTGMILPLIFNPGQQILHEIVEKQAKENNKHVRILLLKSRRFGGSTYTEARYYHKTTMNFNRSTFIVAHEEDATTTLYGMATLMQEKNPLHPSTKKSNAKELIFDTDKGDGLKSQYRLATAKNVEAGKSQGIHYLHCCLHKDSLVILSDGSSKKVQNLLIGDKLITSSGAIAPVKNIFTTGIQRTYKLSTWLSNESIYITADHKILTQDGYKKLKDITKSDYIRLPNIKLNNEIDTYTYNLPYIQRPQGGGTRHQESATISLDYNFGYYIGYYLSEGSSKGNEQKPQSVNFTYHKDEEFIKKANIFASMYATSSNLYTENNKHRTTYYGVFLAGLTEEIAGQSSGKHIPEWFFKTNPEFIDGVLNGYFDGDGSKTEFDHNILSATSVHEKISRQIKRLMIAMNYGVPALRFNNNRWRYDVKTQDIYNIVLTGDTFRRYNYFETGIHKATKYKKINGKYYVKIKSIKQYIPDQTYDIEVDHPDHNFETPIGIVSNSEEGMWQGGGHELLSGLLQCVPPTTAPVDTEIIRESTAKGFGNSFQVDVFKAYAEGKYPYYTRNGIIFAWYNPDSDWILAFIPWFIHPWYTKPFESPEKKIEFDAKINQKVFNHEIMRWEDSEELQLQRRNKLTLEQLYWRAWCIDNPCRGSVDIFHQEYPSTVEEAFLSSGLNYFSKTLCDELEENCEPPVLIGNLIDRMGKTKIKLNKHGHFSIWEKHDPRYDYFMTIDSAGGIKQSQIEEKREPDPSCIDVYNHYTGRQVAQWHGHIDYDMIADMVILIGSMFGRPIACVELLNHGYTVVADLKRKKYPLYEHRPGEPGWIPNRKTKPQALDEYVKLVRDGHMQIVCRETISEMRTFVEKDGKYNSASGCHDERVDTAAMAAIMMTLLPRVIRTGDRKQDQEGIQNWLTVIREKNRGSNRQQPFMYTTR